MGIQSSINSMMNTVAGGIAVAKGFHEKQIMQIQNQNQARKQTQAQAKSIQAQAKKLAQQSVNNEIEAKREQKIDIDKMHTSLGVTVDKLPENARKQVYKEYNR